MTDAKLVISVLVSIKVFAACANFRPLCFVPQSRDFWSAHASSRRFRDRGPTISFARAQQLEDAGVAKLQHQEVRCGRGD